ncbi:sodium:calcium antiporter, partial [Klebsiella oxytoca]
AFGRPAGIALLLLFIVYACMTVARASAEGGNEEDKDEEGEISIWKQILILVVCAVCLFVGANLLVDNGI